MGSRVCSPSVRSRKYTLPSWAEKMTSRRALTFFFSSFRFMMPRISLDHLTMAGWLGQPTPYTLPLEVLMCPSSFFQTTLSWSPVTSAVPKAALRRKLSPRKVSTPASQMV